VLRTMVSNSSYKFPNLQSQIYQFPKGVIFKNHNEFLTFLLSLIEFFDDCTGIMSD